MTKKDPNILVFSVTFNCLILSSWVFLGAMAHNDTIPVKVGVVLDVETPVAKIWLSCLNMGLSDFYSSHPQFNTRLLLSTRDSKRDVVGAASAALDLIKNVQVQAILGPQKSSQAKFMINLGQNSHVPILSFSATNPSLTSTGSGNPYFFRTAANDSTQVKPIASLVKAFGWREVVPIYSDTDFGRGIIPYLVDSLQEVDAGVPYRSVIPPSASDDQIVSELYKLMTMQTRVFVVHMWYELGSRFFTKAHEIGIMGRPGVWIITQDFTDLLSSLSPKVIESMQGVLGVKTFVPRSEELEGFKIRWKMKFQRENPTDFDAQMNVMGLWAYDSAFALALAVEKVVQNGSKNKNKSLFSYEKRSNVSANYSTDLDSFGVSKIGLNLRQALSSTKFRGLAGDFSLVNGKLQTSTFQIVNVNGNGGREIGFWTPQNGLTRTLSFNNSSNNTSGQYSTWRSNILGPIIWPGESTVVPKGWDVPTSEKRLRIGVPVKDGFKEFVDVKTDPNTNVTQVIGFSIDVFKAAVDKLPYALPYDFIPFAKPNGSSAGTYEDMISQVYFGNYDAVVADSTIRAKRSLYIDFTLPYTESDVVMTVPIKENKRTSAWVFLEPLTWDLWVTSTCFFVFIGFVVWVLEHRINDDFRGPPSHQIGTSFWFSFSTMVFAHKEKVVSNLARFVVIIWIFVVLILTQSYTASLTALLTVEQLQPTVTDIEQLLKNGDKIGYLDSSHVHELLIQKGFPAANLVPFKSTEDCEELLAKGSKNGGIAVAIDDSPNIKLFLAQCCSKYKMIGPIFKTAGFGFVFPKGSPLVGDISRVILNVTEGDEMKKIENKWFKKDQSNCPDSSQTKVSASSLSVGSFWGLFLVAGIVSVSSLIIFVVMFLHKHRQILLDTRDSMWTRIRAIFKSFDQKDLNSHTFKKSNFPSTSSTVVDLPNSNCHSSPSSYLVYTGPNSAFLGEQGTLCSGQASPKLEALPANFMELNVVPNNEIIRSPANTLETC